MGITSEMFGKTSRGEEVTLFRLDNGTGATVEVLDYGCTLRSVFVRDRDGRPLDVTLGYDSMAEYERNDGYVGAIAGRCCNRIKDARFSIGGVEHELYANDGKNTLHGGLRGFDKYVWSSEIDGDTLRLSRVSPDGEEGYPGTLSVSVSYCLTGDDRLVITIEASTDADTVVNLTSHAYWNLSGQGEGVIDGHTLSVNASRHTPVPADLCPAGSTAPVVGTPLDLKEPETLSSPLDNNLCVDGVGLREAARLYSPRSGVAMTVLTTQPGLQVYTADYLGDRAGKRGALYAPRSGVALEAQGYPNSVNCPDFPSVILRPGEVYREVTVYAFAVV